MFSYTYFKKSKIDYRSMFLLNQSDIELIKMNLKKIVFKNKKGEKK